MRKLIIATVLLLGVMFAIGQFAEVQSIIDTFQRANWHFILLALIVEILWLINVATSFRVIYNTLGLDEKIGKLVVYSAAANFVNVVAPTAGVGGMAIFITGARKSGYSSGKVTIACGVYLLLDYAGFLGVLTLGLIVLVRRNTLNTAEVIATGILVLIATVLAFLLYLGMRSASELGRALAWMARQVNKVLWPFIHRNYLSEEQAHKFASDAAEGLRELRSKPKGLLLPAILAVNSKALLILILFFMFVAFQVPLSIGTLIAGYSLGYLFFIVSPTPSGVGIVEGVMTLALNSLHVPLHAAAVITLAYRGITFWFPFFIGMIAFRFVSSGQHVESTTG